MDEFGTNDLGLNDDDDLAAMGFHEVEDDEDEILEDPLDILAEDVGFLKEEEI